MKRLLLLALLCVCCSGCASFWNGVASRGGIIGSHGGDYVVISQSGGLIMDVWILEDVFVESEEKSDGWRFVDEDGNVEFIGGDVKVRRVKSKATLKDYHEYHMEFEACTYRQMYNRPPGMCGVKDAE